MLRAIEGEEKTWERPVDFLRADSRGLISDALCNSGSLSDVSVAPISPRDGSLPPTNCCSGVESTATRRTIGLMLAYPGAAQNRSISTPIVAPMTVPTRRPEHPIDELFTRRWSPRSYTGEAIPEPVLMGLFEAARWAPSASNIQPWRFVYGKAGTPAWQSIFDGLVPFNQTWALRASALIVVLSHKTSLPPGKTERVDNRWHAFDAGAAWASLAFQATLSGWAAHAMGGFDADRLRASLAVPSEVSIDAVIAVGKQADAALLPEALQARELPSGRLALAQIAAEGRYSDDF